MKQVVTPVLRWIVIRGASIVLAALAAGAVIWFTALYLGGYSATFAYERMALVPLIAGLGAGVLEAYRRGSLSRLTAAVDLILLAAWALFLRIPR